jgi:hypothetical protein
MNRYQILRGEKLPYVKPKVTVTPWVQDVPQIQIIPAVEPAEINGAGWTMVENVGIGVYNPCGMARVVRVEA